MPSPDIVNWLELKVKVASAYVEMAAYSVPKRPNEPLKGVLRRFRRENALTRPGYEKEDLIGLAAEHGGFLYFHVD